MKKTQKTPPREIEQAKRELEDFRAREKEAQEQQRQEISEGVDENEQHSDKS